MKGAGRYQTDTDSDQSETRTSLLIQAAMFGDSAAIETLIAEGANINAATKGGTTPLMMAASFGQLAALRLLHERGAAINKMRNDGFNALTFAVFFGHEDVVRELLTRGADINAKGRGGTTAEIWATARGFTNIAELLKETTAPSASTDQGHAAVTSGSTGDREREGVTGRRGDEHLAVAGGSFPDDDLDFHEGIRRVGQKEWTTTTSTESTGQYHPAVASEHTSQYHPAVPGGSFPDDDLDFHEGIRRVGQKEWTTTPPTAPTGHYHPTVASDHTSQYPLAVASESFQGADLDFGEGIRRVGQTKWTTTPPTAPAGHYHPTVASEHTGPYHLAVAGGSFSPFSTLGDRLGLSWKHAAVIGVFVVALSGVGTVVALKELKHEPQPTSPTASEQPLKSQPLDHTEPQSQRSVDVSTEQRPSEPAEPSNLDDSSRAGRVNVAEIPAANHIVAEPDAAKTLAPNSRVATRAPSKNRPRKRAVRPGDSEDEFRATNAPAAVTFSKQPASPTRRATAPNNIPVQPATLIEGSTTKKKVIQWP